MNNRHLLLIVHRLFLYPPIKNALNDHQYSWQKSRNKLITTA